MINICIIKENWKDFAVEMGSTMGSHIMQYGPRSARITSAFFTVDVLSPESRPTDVINSYDMVLMDKEVIMKSIPVEALDSLLEKERVEVTIKDTTLINCNVILIRGFEKE